MCMKVRVTELEKEENTSGEVGEEKESSGEEKAEGKTEKGENDATTHMEEEETIDEELIRVMRWIGEENRVDEASIARAFSLKEHDVLSTLEKMRRS